MFNFLEDKTKNLVLDLSGVKADGSVGVLFDTFTVTSSDNNVVSFVQDEKNPLKFIGTKVGPGTATLTIQSNQRPDVSTVTSITIANPEDIATGISVSISEQTAPIIDATTPWVL